MRPHEADRVAALLLTVGLGVLLAPMALRMLDQWGRFQAWWQLGAYLGVVVAIGLAIAGRVLWSARTIVWVTIVALYSLPFVATPAPAQPWISSVVPTAAAATVLIGERINRGLAVLFILIGGVVWDVDHGEWGAAPREQVIGDILFSIAIAAIGLAFLTAVRESQARLDQAQSDAVAQFTQARTSDAMIQAANLWDAYIHDEVLAALTSVRLDPSSADTRAEAAAAVARARSRATGTVPVPELADGLLEAVLEVLPSVDTHFDRAPDALELAPNVRLALIEAATEALRNVHDHALPDQSAGWSDGLAAGGSPAAPAVLRLTQGPDSVTVELRDRGPGFDPRQVDPARLGIAVSIYGRMSSVGGSASVQSRRGAGVYVRLQWPAEGAAR
ncbi:MAG: hypothetical protein WAW88_07975 [Nocardioides sp.]